MAKASAYSVLPEIEEQEERLRETRSPNLHNFTFSLAARASEERMTTTYGLLIVNYNQNAFISLA